MTKQILAFLFCFIRELNLYSPLTLTLTSAHELKPILPPYPHPHLRALSLWLNRVKDWLEDKDSIEDKEEKEATTASSHLAVLSKAAHSGPSACDSERELSHAESPTAHSLHLILNTIVRSAELHSIAVSA